MLAIGSDHGGYSLKEELKRHLDTKGVAYKDFGTHNGESCNYAEIARIVCKSILDSECENAILVCGTGIGISIAANKIKGIRAAACSDYMSAKYTRLHNNANVLCLGGRVIGPGLAAELVDVFLASGFEGGRHAERLGTITDIENKGC